MSLNKLLQSQKPVDTDLDSIFQKSKAQQEDRAAITQARQVAQQFKKRKSAKAPVTAKGLPKPVDPSSSSSESETERSPKKPKPKKRLVPAASSDSDSEEEIVHEALQKPGKKSSKPLADTEESRAARDARTLFLSNVPVSCAVQKTQKRALLALLATHLAQINEKAKIESMRFRSLPLTASLGKASKRPLEPEPGQEAKEDNSSRKRAKAWSRRQTGEDADDEPAQPVQKFQTAAQKRKTAFITGNLASDDKAKGGCNVYAVVRELEGDAEGQAVRAVIAGLVASLQGIEFEGRRLRADHVSGGSKVVLGDEKCTVFVGGLDFEESDASLTAWIEGLIEAEKGKRKDGQGWVRSVRVVRDSESGLGKGIAYALLQDTECVEELLALDPAQLKLSKRKIRFEKCKSDTHMKAVKKLDRAPDRTDAKKAKGEKKVRAVKPKKRVSQAEKEKLGERIKDLPKEERKSAKKSDVDRVARRLEKKAAKTAALKRESRIAQAKKKLATGMLKKVGKKVGAKAAVKKGSGTKKKSA